MFSRKLMLILALSNASLLSMESVLAGENLVLWQLFDTLSSNTNPEKWQNAKHKQLLDACKTLDFQALKNYLSCQEDEDIGTQFKKEVKALTNDDQEKAY